MSRRTLRGALLLVILALQVSAQVGDRAAQLLLLAKARALDSRGRQDLAARTWKLVLLGDPKNIEALAAMSRYSAQSGNATAAREYLSLLRKLQPNASMPEPTGPVAPRDPRLRAAEVLAQSGKYEEAVRKYQDIFGTSPPAGQVAVQYYEAMAGAKGRVDEAIQGLERLLLASPGSLEYRLALGRIQTYGPRTRNQGMLALKGIPVTSAYTGRARAAWRQALIWDNGAAASLPLLRDYLAQYPDPELAKVLSSAGVAAGRPVAQSPKENLAFETLNLGNTDAAVSDFEQAIQETPRSVTAYAGLGYALMRRQSWAEAARAWDQAIKLAPGNKVYTAARANAGYFLAMEEGTGALKAGAGALARQRFEAAVALRPQSLDAQRGLAGALMLAGDNKAAAAMFEKLISVEPAVSENWRSLIAARAKAGEGNGALAIWLRTPTVIRVALGRDGELQLLLAGIYLDGGQPKEAAFTYQIAARLDPANVVAWEGWLAALMASNQDGKAYETLSGMPPKIYQEALERPGFLRLAALIQIHAGRLDTVEALLLKWIAKEGVDKVPADIQTQLAGIWIKQGKSPQAEKLLRGILARDPNNVDATRLLLGALQSQNRAAEALVEIKRLPVMVDAQLQQDAGYQALLASINSDAGNQGEALRLVRESLSRLSQKGEAAPGTLLLQQAWLLLNTSADGHELWGVLRLLATRTDLSATQHASYLDLWSVWAQRQADEARRAGNLERATAILAEASIMFPADPRIRGAYAGSLVESGETKKALAVYVGWGLADATPTDYSAAIGTAMAEKSDLANRWLDDAMKKFPMDSTILGLAGQMATQQGNFDRAELYYRGALALKERTPQADSLVVNRDPGGALGRVLVGEPAPTGKTDTDTARMGRVLSGEAAAETLPARSFGFSISAPAKSERERITDRLRLITARNTPYLQVSTSVYSRSGTAGFDRRTLLETDISTSKVLANAVRVTLVVRPTSIQTEASDGASEIFRFGLLPTGSSFAAQSVAGLGAEAQISTDNVGLRLGAGPQGFPVRTFVAGLRFKPAGGHLTIQLTRDNVKDSLLSYAGQQDPITKQVWGGVMANQGQLTGNWGSEKSGAYLSAGYGIFTGQNVETNRAFNGNGGTYWRVLQRPEGALTVGLNLTGMAYAKNLRYYTLGHGGYFSPQRYYIFNVPVTWRGKYGPRFQYVLNAGLGTQHFREDSSSYFPTLPSLQNVTLLSYAGQSQTGSSYSVDFNGIYQLSAQWYLEGFFNLNNARNFTAQSAGFRLKYGFQPRPVTAEPGPRAVPDWTGAQPFQP